MTFFTITLLAALRSGLTFFYADLRLKYFPSAACYCVQWMVTSPFLVLCIVPLDLAERPVSLPFPLHIIILSHMRGLRDEYKGFWIGWLDLLVLLYNYNQLYQLPKTRSIPCWTTSVFSSTLTDLVLVYELVTSLAYVVLWLTFHSWTMNSLTTELRCPVLLCTASYIGYL
jgi:hypothetical protein